MGDVWVKGVEGKGVMGGEGGWWGHIQLHWGIHVGPSFVSTRTMRAQVGDTNHISLPPLHGCTSFRANSFPGLLMCAAPRVPLKGAVPCAYARALSSTLLAIAPPPDEGAATPDSAARM